MISVRAPGGCQTRMLPPPPAPHALTADRATRRGDIGQFIEFQGAHIRSQQSPSLPLPPDRRRDRLIVVSQEAGPALPSCRRNLIEGLDRRGVAVQASTNDLPIDHPRLVTNSGEKHRHPVAQPPGFDIETLDAVAAGFQVQGEDATADRGPVILFAGRAAEDPRLADREPAPPSAPPAGAGPTSSVSARTSAMP